MESKVMSEDVLAVFQRKDLSWSAKATHLGVWYFDQGEGCQENKETIGKTVGLSAGQVYLGLRELVDAGILSREPRGAGQTNIYRSLIARDINADPPHA